MREGIRTLLLRKVGGLGEFVKERLLMGLELPKWNKAGGSVLAGLTRRRAAEVVLFKTASSVTAHPPPC